jgi:hypothetical protein
MCRCVKGKCYTYDGKQTAAICSVDPCLTRAPFVKCGNKRSDGGGDGFWGAAPDPGLGASIELSRGDTGGLFDLVRRGLALPSQRNAWEEPPPALLQVEEACPFGNEDLMETRMLGQPGPGLGTVVAGQMIGDDGDLPSRVIRLDVPLGERCSRWSCAKRYIWSAPCHRALVVPHPPRFSPALGCNPVEL